MPLQKRDELFNAVLESMRDESRQTLLHRLYLVLSDHAWYSQVFVDRPRSKGRYDQSLCAESNTQRAISTAREIFAALCPLMQYLPRYALRNVENFFSFLSNLAADN